MAGSFLVRLGLKAVPEEGCQAAFDLGKHLWSTSSLPGQKL